MEAEVCFLSLVEKVCQVLTSSSKQSRGWGEVKFKIIMQ